MSRVVCIRVIILIKALDFYGTFCANIAFPSTCEEAKNLLTLEKANDGEYCLNVYDNMTGRINNMVTYCHNMKSDNPSEYLTLPAGQVENYSKYKKYVDATNEETDGEVYFNKVKLNLGFPHGNLSISSRDFTFTEIKNRVQIGTSVQFMAGYGMNSDCDYCIEGYCNDFKINLSGTSITLLPEATVGTFGWNTVIQSLNVSANLQHVHAQCGGMCGGCVLQDSQNSDDAFSDPRSDPDLKIYVQVNSSLGPADACGNIVSVENLTQPAYNMTFLTDRDTNTCARLGSDNVKHMYCRLLGNSRAILKLTTEPTQEPMVAISITLIGESCEDETIMVFSTESFPSTCQSKGNSSEEMIGRICTMYNQVDSGATDQLLCIFHCEVKPQIIISINVHQYGSIEICDLKHYFFYK